MMQGQRTGRETAAEPGQIREDDWRRWYVGIGEREFMCRYETIAGNIEPQLLSLPAWMFTQGMVGRPVGRWTGDLLDPHLSQND